MMNHHLPAMPHGPPPMPPRRQHEMHYSNAPPAMRSPPAYMGYHPPPVNGHIPPAYVGQQYPPPWFPSYRQMHPPPPPPPPGAATPPGPPRSYQPYAPLIVSSYPHSQPVLASAHLPPPTLPSQPRSAASTPFQSTMSPPPPGLTLNQPEGQDHPSSSALPVIPATNLIIPSFPAAEPPKSGPPFKEPFRAPLPWLSVPDQAFPARAPHRRRSGLSLQTSATLVEFPAKETQRRETIPPEQNQHPLEIKSSEAAAPLASEPQTPVTSHAPSETDSTHPTTPSSAAPIHATARPQNQAQLQAKTSKPAVPLVPVVPIFPQSPSTPRQAAKESGEQTSSATPESLAAAKSTKTESTEPTTAPVEQTVSPPPPKSWADLVRSKGQAQPVNHAPGISTEAGGAPVPRNESLADVLNSLGPDVDQYSEKIAFLEPRGLVNTGNMCYMNSVLQILAFCVPFYHFLDYVGRRAAHSFKSDVPLIDATIMFMKEFRVIDTARSEDQLRLRLKHNELEEYGEAFIPEFVYQVIRQLPRFRDMRRGHQQDAQEFLGFLLEELHEECTHAMRSGVTTGSDLPTSTNIETATSGDGPSTDGWLEVGHKQKPAITRSSGHISLESPITKIFGGKIRSEFRVPGNKNSVTLEPYQPLQLDIGAPEVNSIIDALKGLTKPETIHGDFSSSRGPKVAATKQVFIETLPPVLILHLKRFQYDSVTRGTQKIWKKIGYPLELEIPREVFPPHRRNAMAIHGGPPKYRLIGVIYHHGKNAGGGHYTVDVRRQDGREWIRMDDTVIHRVRSEDVAEAGSEEDPKVLAAALDQHKRDRNPNIYEQFEQDEQDQVESDRGWSQVNGAGSSGHASKKSTSHAVTNGISSPAPSGSSPGTRTPIGRYGNRDNKVAYLLFYQRISNP